MPRKQAFELSEARPLLEQALTGAGYDVIDDPADPNLVQARYGDPGDVVSVVVDAGGRMRFTRVRQAGPEETAELRITKGRAARLVRRSDETLTVVLRLTGADARRFAAILAELEAI